MVVLLAGGLTAWMLSGSDGEGAAAMRPAGPRLTVDVRSIGGRCSDARPVAEVAPARPWCSLAHAARAAPRGSTIIVRRGSYPQLALTDVRKRSMVTLKARTGERPRIAGVVLKDVANLRLEGFRVTEPSRIDASEHVQVIASEMSPHGFLTGGGSDLLFAHDDFHDLTIDIQPAGVPGARCNVQSPTAGIAPRCGYGLRIGDTRRVVVRDNRFRNIPADGIQAAGSADLQVLRNRFEHIAPFIDKAEHSDGIQFAGGNASPVIRQNIFTRCRGVIAIPDDGPVTGTTTDAVIEDNVFAGPGNFAVSLYDTTNLRFAGNTAWGTSGGVMLREHPNPKYTMTGVTMQDNIIQRLLATPRMFAVRDHNLIAAGPRTGRHEIAGTPRFGRRYRLARGSRGIADGTRSASPRPDVYGEARPRNRPVDLGAVQGR